MARKQVEISKEALWRLTLLERLLNITATYRLIIDSLLNDRERRRLERSEKKWPSIVDAWAWLKRVHRLHAIVELAWRTQAIGRDEYIALARDVGMKLVRRSDLSQSPEPIKPVYRDGVLEYRGQAIRKVRQFRKPSSVQDLLDAFQRQGWRRSIENPLANHFDPQALDKAIFQLNRTSGKRGLSEIQFSRSDGGNRVTWTERE